MVEYSHDENIEDARKLARMFLAIAKCPKPVIARVHGAALGGARDWWRRVILESLLSPPSLGLPK